MIPLISDTETKPTAALCARWALLRLAVSMRAIIIPKGFRRITITRNGSRDRNRRLLADYLM